MNLTVVIDDHVLRGARIRALQEGTSVNAVVRARLEEYASQGNSPEARVRGWEELWTKAASLPEAEGERDPRPWTREDAYDRKVFR